MESPWLHRFAIAVAASTLSVLVTGAMLTDYKEASAAAPLLSEIHLILSAVVAAMMVGLAIWLAVAKSPGWLTGLGWGACTTLILQVLLTNLGAMHAIVAQLFFASTVVIVAGTSSLWEQGPDQVHDQGWPSLRFLGNTMFLLVLSQVALGAAFRHKATGLMPHLVGAMVVALWILIVCMFVMQQFPEHRSLRPSANVLLAFTLAQVFLGIAALTMRMMNADNTPALLITTAGHVMTGALTLSAATVLTLQIRRNVLPKLVEEEEETDPSPTSAS